MVGGRVIEVCEVPGKPDRLWIDVMERSGKHPDRCPVLVEKNSLSMQIELGDQIWWQGGKCFWTPQKNYGKTGGKSGLDYDVELRKIGGSGVTYETARSTEK